jgi:DNA invertase Pin-like site-specific DNA recombinase
MVTPHAAAIYARISSDQGGAGLGVARQVQDCRQLADRLGWPVADEYIDNDVSAYSGRRRPEYERMLADLAAGERDAVIVYHVDRLTRRPIELEQFLAALDTARVRHVRFVVGDSDMMTGDGLMVVRIMAAMAANESATKSRRVSRKLIANAEAGLPPGGGRAFGYRADKLTIDEAEAAVVRDLVARFLAGESTRSLAVWLNEQAVPTVGGKPWVTSAVRQVIGSERIAGLRVHRGVQVGRAVWPGIITEEQHRRVRELMDRNARTGRRNPRRYLLSGLLRCGKCGTRLYSAAREDTRRYVCLSGPDHGGCGGLTVVAAPVETLIAAAVLHRLDSPELADALAGRAAQGEATAAAVTALTSDQEQLAELSAAYADRQITMREWLEARKPIQARIYAAEKRIARVTRTDALAGLPGNGQALRGSWDGLNLTRQAAIVAAVLDHALIRPGTPGSRSLDPNRVQPVWRL